jgi:uncharacterized protein (TIGR02596 family)
LIGIDCGPGCTLDIRKFAASHGIVPRRSRPPGFTLLEILLTVAILLLLLFLAILGFSREIDAAAIDSGTQMVDDCLAEARQDAVAQNTPVEVRLYAAPAGNGYSLLQLHWKNSDGTTPPISPPVILPGGAVIDATAAHSSLVTTNTATPPTDPGDSRLNATTRCFHFLPDGSTDLATTGEWTLTVRALSQSDPAHFPANWGCVKLDPVSGRAQIYRP